MNYKVFCLNDALHVVSLKEFVAADDAAALKQAEESFQASALELWQGNRYVTLVAKGRAWSDTPGHISPERDETLPVL